jgi:hypothetical protein
MTRRGKLSARCTPTASFVAFREDDGAVSIETAGGRVAAQLGDWIIKSGDEDFLLGRPSSA